MAAMLPGLGHVYTKRYQDATVAFLLNGLFIWGAVEAFNEDLDVLGGLLLFVEAGWYAGNIYSAVNATHKYNKKTKDEFRQRLSDQLDLNLLVTREGQLGEEKFSKETMLKVGAGKDKFPRHKLIIHTDQ